MNLGSITINTDLELIGIVEAVYAVCTLLKCTKYDRIKIGTAANALAIHIFEYSGECVISFSLVEKDTDKYGLEFSVCDQGRSREDIESALLEKPCKSDCVGLGLFGVKNAVDEFHIEPIPKNGIKISAITWLKPKIRITDSTKGKIRETFKLVSEKSTLEMLKILNEDFNELLNSLQQKNDSLLKINRDIKAQAKKMAVDLVVSDGKLKAELSARILAETEFSKRQQALEAIFQLTTQRLSTLNELTEAVIKQIAHLSGAPFVSISINSNMYDIKQVISNGFVTNGCSIHHDITNYQTDDVVSFSGNLADYFESDRNDFAELNFAAGIPIRIHSGTLVGCLYVFFKNEKKFEDFEENLLKTFARFIAVETNRFELEAQLEQDKEMKALGQITSGVAHEVRNPLNAIVTVSEALFRKISDSPEYQRHIEHIRNQVERLTALMQELLDLGRPIRAESTRIMPVEVFVTQAINAWRESSQFKHREIILSLDDSIKTKKFKADPARFQQALINLLDNAFHYCPEDPGVSLAVSLDDLQDGITIRVVDKGPGIEEKYMDKFFEPFFSMRKGGTGLGTSIVKRIVLLHGGQVTVYNNEPPPGLCVEIWLPTVTEQMQ